MAFLPLLFHRAYLEKGYPYEYVLINRSLLDNTLKYLHVNFEVN